MPDEFNVALNIVIAAHNAPSPTQDGGFNDRIIVWVPALADIAGRRNFDGARGQRMLEVAPFSANSLSSGFPQQCYNLAVRPRRFARDVIQ